MYVYITIIIVIVGSQCPDLERVLPSDVYFIGKYVDVY